MKNLKLFIFCLSILIGNSAISQFKAGYLDKTGKEAIPAQFESANSFSQGLAAVKMNGKWGFIDKTGAFILKPIYDNIVVSFLKINNQAVALVEIDGVYKYINKSGTEVTEPQIEIAANELRPFSDNKFTWGYKDVNEKIIVPAIYDCARSFSGGYGVIGNKEKYGLINALGKIVMPITFEEEPIYGDGIFVVKRNGKYELLNDKLATLVILDKIPNLQQCNTFANGVAAIKVSDKWGLINKKGEIVLQAQYENCITFYDGVAKAKKDGIIGLINTKGEPIGNVRDKEYWGFSEGLSVYQPMDQSGRQYQGFIDKTGAVVISVQYIMLENFSEGLAKFEKNIEKSEGAIVASTIGNSNASNSSTAFDSKSNAIATLSAIHLDGTNQGDVQHKNRELVYIVNDAGQWTSAKLNQESTAIEAMLKSGLYSETDFNKISNRASETTYPLALSTYMLREKNMPLARNYACIRIAQFTTSYAPYSVLWIPKADNMNMPDQMQPTSDNGFYIVEKTSSVSTTKNPTSGNQVQGLNSSYNATTNSTTSTTSGNISTSSYALDIFNNLGSMAIYVGNTMYVVLVKGKNLGNVDTVSARAAAKVGVTNFKYQWFSGNSCEGLKAQYGSVFNVRCGYELSLD
jgi:hypothetical protein